MRISHPIYCWISANWRAYWNLLWEAIVTWCSLASNVLLSFSKRHLPLLALSHLKCHIKSEGHNMKISHSLQGKMFWPGQAGLNISAACQERCIDCKTQFKVHWAALDNITPWMAAISIVWKVSTAYLKTLPPPNASHHPCAWKASRIPLEFIAWSVIQPFTIQEPALWSPFWQRRRQPYP